MTEWPLKEHLGKIKMSFSNAFVWKLYDLIWIENAPTLKILKVSYKEPFLSHLSIFLNYNKSFVKSYEIFCTMCWYQPDNPQPTQTFSKISLVKQTTWFSGSISFTLWNHHITSLTYSLHKAWLVLQQRLLLADKQKKHFGIMIQVSWFWLISYVLIN